MHPRPPHRAIILTAAIVLLGGMGVLAVALEAERSRELAVGQLWPDVDSAMSVSVLAGEHVLLYAADCFWCARQLPVLRKNIDANDALPLRIVVLVAGPTDSATGTRKIQDALSTTYKVSYTNRSALERMIGPIGTPTHLVIGRTGRILALHAGYLDTDALRAWRAASHARVSSLGMGTVSR